MIHKEKLVQELSKKIVAASMAVNSLDDSSLEHIQATEQLAIYTEVIDLVESEALKVEPVETKKEMDPMAIILEVAQEVGAAASEKSYKERLKQLDNAIATKNENAALQIMMSDMF